jgi:hypothetical protein
MKKPAFVFLALCLAAAALDAGEADVVLRAQREAEQDGRAFHAWWWGIGGATAAVAPVVAAAFTGDWGTVDLRRAVALAGPVLAGGGLALVGWTVGTVGVPDERIAAIRGEWDDPGLWSLYESEYRRTATRIRHRQRGVAALVGAGAAAGAMGLFGLVVVLTK